MTLFFVASSTRWRCFPKYDTGPEPEDGYEGGNICILEKRQQFLRAALRDFLSKYPLPKQVGFAGVVTYTLPATAAHK